MAGLLKLCTYHCSDVAPQNDWSVKDTSEENRKSPVPVNTSARLAQFFMLTDKIKRESDGPFESAG